MKKIFLRPALAILAAAALLTACGGGHDRGDDATAPPGTGTGTELPSSATADSNSLVAYLKQLIATRTDDSSEPVVLGTAVLPTDEVSEPLPVN